MVTPAGSSTLNRHGGDAVKGSERVVRGRAPKAVKRANGPGVKETAKATGYACCRWAD